MARMLGLAVLVALSMSIMLWSPTSAAPEKVDRLAEAEDLLIRVKPEQALAIAEKESTKNPDWVEAHVLVARCLERLERYMEAADAYAGAGTKAVTAKNETIAALCSGPAGQPGFMGRLGAPSNKKARLGDARRTTR